jgi:hypothetical protein
LDIRCTGAPFFDLDHRFFTFLSCFLIAVLTSYDTSAVMIFAPTCGHDPLGRKQKMNKILRLVFCAGLTLCVPLAIAAPPPQTISYQGYLTNAAGVPTTTSQVMTFRIYDDAVAGLPAAALWTGTQLSVPVTNGVFNVILGGPLQTPFPPTLLFDKPYFLSVQVNPELLEMSPRQPLQMSPYAYRAVVADAVSAATAIPGAQVTGAILQGGNTLGAAMSVGTKDNNSFSILANNVAAFRVVPTATSPNLIGGSTTNFVAVGVAAAVVSGGGLSGTNDPITDFSCGTSSCANRVTDNGGSVGGGIGNQAGDATGTTTDTPYATVGGGVANKASGRASTVGGGNANTASGGFSTIGGGAGNMASSTFSTVGGGAANTASSLYSTVAGGSGNTASGSYSFAAGNRAKTQTTGTSPVVHDGAFVWADNNYFDFNSTAANEFSARATGGFRFVTAINVFGVPTRTFSIGADGAVTIPIDSTAANVRLVSTIGEFARVNMLSQGQSEWTIGAGGPGNRMNFYRADAGDAMSIQPSDATNLLLMSNGARLTAGGAWTNSSDRNSKTEIVRADLQAVLRQLAALPIHTWRYKAEDEAVHHIGPMAQDFRAAFGFGNDDKSITTVDADGVALAAIQGLNQVVNEKEVEIKQQRVRIEMLEEALAAIQSRLGMR